MNSRSEKWWRWTLTGLISIAAVCTVLAFVADPFVWEIGPKRIQISKGFKPIANTLLLVALRLVSFSTFCGYVQKIGSFFRSRGFKRACLAVGSVVLFFGAFELVLKGVGFEAELPPLVVKGDVEIGDGSSRYMIPDRELKWKLNPGGVLNGRTVNSMGFFDREVDPVKKPGSMRVICMGDSCTGQGQPPYSGFLNDMLTNAPPTAAAWESFNMGVHGYSSVQGLRLFQLRGKPLQPDIVTLYYGWNDHWNGSRPDSNTMGVRVNAVSGWFLETLRDRRVFQFMIHLMNPVRQIARTQNELGQRVPKPEYDWTLRKYVEEIRSIGARPILLTAPRAEKLTPLLVTNKQTQDLAEVTRLHDEYNDIARKVAADLGVPLVDVAAQFTGPESAELFSGDGIHLKMPGRQKIAQGIYDEIIRLERGQKPARDSSP